MSIAPLKVPATAEINCAELRLSRLSVVQNSLGGPTMVTYTLSYFDKNAGDAPAQFAVNGSVQLSLEAMLSLPGMAAAIDAITTALIGEAVKAGILSEA